MALSNVERRFNPLGNTFVNLDLDLPDSPSIDELVYVARPQRRRSSSCTGAITYKDDAETDSPVRRGTWCGSRRNVQSSQARMEEEELAVQNVAMRGTGQQPQSSNLTSSEESQKFAYDCIPCPDEETGEDTQHEEKGETTMMIRNLPKVSQADLLAELNKAGFKDTFDFAYMPCHFSEGKGKGYAFVNFITAEAANRIVLAWNKLSRFGKIFHLQPPLSVAPAVIQGFDANVAKWGSPRMSRIRNPNLRPFISVAARHAVALPEDAAPQQAVQAALPRQACRQVRGAPGSDVRTDQHASSMNDGSSTCDARITQEIQHVANNYAPTSSMFAPCDGRERLLTPIVEGNYGVNTLPSFSPCDNSVHHLPTAEGGFGANCYAHGNNGQQIRSPCHAAAEVMKENFGLTISPQAPCGVSNTAHLQSIDRSYGNYATQFSNCVPPDGTNGQHLPNGDMQNQANLPVRSPQTPGPILSHRVQQGNGVTHQFQELPNLLTSMSRQPVQKDFKIDALQHAEMKTHMALASLLQNAHQQPLQDLVRTMAHVPLQHPPPPPPEAAPTMIISGYPEFSPLPQNPCDVLPKSAVHRADAAQRGLSMRSFNVISAHGGWCEEECWHC